MKRTFWFAFATTGLLLVALALLISGTSLPALAQTASLDVVQTDAGLIAMTRDSGPDVRMFKMIPYAAPPVGDLRWKPPQPVTPWQGTRRAENFSPMCMQVAPSILSAYYLSTQAMSEDCLYMNVWTPAKSGTEKLPVIVLIPPGANSSNSASNPQFEGTSFAKKGVVL